MVITKERKREITSISLDVLQKIFSTISVEDPYVNVENLIDANKDKYPIKKLLVTGFDPKDDFKSKLVEHAVYDKKNQYLYVRDAEISKQRFAVVHDLGHMVLNHKEQNTGQYVYTRIGTREKLKLFFKMYMFKIRSFFQFKKNKKKSLEDKFYNCKNKLIQEEEADFFAASILMPFMLFAHWVDKSSDELMEKFGVSKKGIAKRKKEFQQLYLCE